MFVNYAFPRKHQLCSILAIVLGVLFNGEVAFAQPYTNLLDGQELNHWIKPGGAELSGGWQFEPGGVLHLDGKGGNIVTRDLYGDFELWFEFKVAQKGNSGIKYRVKQYGKSWLGLEYQVLDDDAYAKQTRDHLTASLYDLVSPIPAVTRLKPRDEFNIGHIRVQNGRTQHWVNGQLMIDSPLAGPTWKSHVANSKFKKHDGFGENVLGRIMLTDHNSEAWYRNVFIRRLGGVSCGCQICGN